LFAVISRRNHGLRVWGVVEALALHQWVARLPDSKAHWPRCAPHQRHGPLPLATAILISWQQRLPSRLSWQFDDGPFLFLVAPSASRGRLNGRAMLRTLPDPPVENGEHTVRRRSVSAASAEPPRTAERLPRWRPEYRVCTAQGLLFLWAMSVPGTGRTRLGDAVSRLVPSRPQSAFLGIPRPVRLQAERILRTARILLVRFRCGGLANAPRRRGRLPGLLFLYSVSS